MRLLDNEGITYEVLEYPVDEDDLSGEHVAQVTQNDPDSIFKTLILQGERNGYFACCLPCRAHLDLKKAAAAFHDKSANMIHMKDLKNITGYVRGGCSPIGMKKPYPVFIDETCILYDKIFISAGIRGAMLLLRYDDLLKATTAELFDFTSSAI